MVPLSESFVKCTKVAALVEVYLFEQKVKLRPTGRGKESSITVLGGSVVISLDLGDLCHPGDLSVWLASSFIQK